MPETTASGRVREAEGKVLDAWAAAARSALPELDQLAMNSMKRFRWRPARRSGKKVAVIIPLAFRFTIPTKV